MVVVILILLNVLKPIADKKDYRPKKLKVFIERSIQQDTQLFAYSQGETKPKQEVVLKSQVEGKITYISPNVVVGGRVKKGQLLLSVDKTDYQLLVIQREANVAQSEQQLITVQAQADIANQELKTLGRENPNDLALWVPQLVHAKAAVKASEALLEKAKLDLSRTNVYAPFNAVIRDENVTVAQQVSRNNELATLYATDVMEVRLALNGEQLGILDLPIDYYVNEYKDGLPIQLDTQIGNQHITWPAKLMRTAGEFDSGTRTLDVIAEVQQQQDLPLLLPGLFVNAKLSGRKVKNVTILARTTVKPNNLIWYVDDKGFLQHKTVTPIYRNSQHVIVKGLKKNTKIVTSALVSPTPGVAVRAIDPSSDQVEGTNLKRDREKGKGKGKRETRRGEKDSKPVTGKRKGDE